MLKTRYEQYEQSRGGLPFVFNPNISRDRFNSSKEANWHENLEIQYCIKGSGSVLLDGKIYPFYKNNFAVVNSNTIHYTGTDSELAYDCIIISTSFCKQTGFPLSNLNLEPIIENKKITEIFFALKEVYFDLSTPYRKAKLNNLLLQLLLELAENHNIEESSIAEKNKSYENVKLAILYIRDNYHKKITLDEIAKSAFCDKYTLCKDFKKYTGQTVFQSLNNYRCIKAIDYLSAGYTVAETAANCGFDNFSFFTKTFKTYIGKLPSEYKK